MKTLHGNCCKRAMSKMIFLCNLKERENNYPTGIDITPISTELANVAIPHTEGEFVNARLIVPVKLTQEVTFKNMILPDEELSVKFLFMILNNDPEGRQTYWRRLWTS